MAVKIIKSGNSASESMAVFDTFKKNMGEHVAHYGNEIQDITRIPTGILPLDLSIGGGIPRNRLSIIFGAESSNKTALAYLLMAQVQREGQRAVYLDLERSCDPIWAAKFGLNMKDLIILEPNYAEQAVDMVEAMLYANDVGIVVVDSIAAMTTDNEIASSAEKMNVGGNSYIVGKMVRKAVTALGQGRDNHPALLCLNQTRFKIGFVMGDPTVTPGGNSLKFASALTIRVYGKPEIIKDVHPAIPALLHITGSIVKAKIPVTSRAFEYDLVLIPHDNMKVGMSPAWSFVASKCKEIGLLKQEGTGTSAEWKLCGKKVKLQRDMKALYESDSEFRLQVNALITEDSLSKANCDTIIVPSSYIDPETGELLVV